MKALKWIFLGLVTFVVVAFIGAYGYLKATLPDYDGEITLSGITGEVQIIRDSYGMPHIYAENDKDAYFALGYSMAQDRLFQMDMVRRAIRGRLSEILGAELVPVDKLFRTITAKKPLEELYAEYPDEVTSAMEAYSAGINYYIENHSGPLPIEFKILGYEPEKWDPTDCGAVYYYMAWDLNSSFSTEMLFFVIKEKLGEEMVMELIVDYPEGYPTIMPEGFYLSSYENNIELLETMRLAREVLGVEGGGASNNWVISGVKSETGMPILANDMHLGHGSPGIWYEAHLVTPNMNVSGVIIPGIPFVVVGANEHVAWGFTNVMADGADYYFEKLNPENPDQYLFMDEWEEMEIRDEVIKVKGGEDVNYRIRLTNHGPVIDDVNDIDEPEGYAISMRWIAPELPSIAISLYHFNRAEDIYDMEDAMEFFKCPSQNVVYADDKGNIGYWAGVGIPIREGFSGLFPVPGWTGEYEWQGFVPTDEQPHMTNPDRGWCATANNKHTGPGYPYTISHYYAMPDRYTRIAEMITEKDVLNITDIERMQADIYVLLAADWVPMMIKSLEGAELTEHEKAALDVLSEWDYLAKPDSIGSSIFHSTINKLAENSFKKRLRLSKDELSEGETNADKLYELYIDNYFIALNALRKMIQRGESPWFDDPDTDKVEGLDDLFVKSFKDGVQYLSDEFGADIDGWKWGKIHTLTIYHPFGKASPLMGHFLNIGPLPMWGSLSSVSPAPYHLTHPFEVYHGASERYIFDLSDIDNSLRIIPTGISGNFMSPHYDDQVDLWRTNTYRSFVLSREKVESDARYTLILKPE